MEAWTKIRSSLLGATTSQELTTGEKLWMPLLLCTDKPKNVSGVPVSFLRQSFDLLFEKRWFLEFGVPDGDAFYVASTCMGGDVEGYDKMYTHVREKYESLLVPDHPWPFAGALLDPAWGLRVAHIAVYDAHGNNQTFVVPGTYMVRVLVFLPDDKIRQMEQIVVRVGQRRSHLRMKTSRALLSSLVKTHKSDWFVMDVERGTAKEKLGFMEIQAASILQSLPLMSSANGSLFPITFTVRVIK